MIEVVEMDTVVSCKSGKKCILTLLFRKSNFMLGFLLEEKTSKCVDELFRKLQIILGKELYRRTFSCILTDRGTEFCNPLAIEFFYENGEKIANVFYCDPYTSSQKGKIEKNHVELRKVFPKPTNFDKFTQDDINLALHHINSEPRKCLNNNCPGVIARLFIDQKIMDLIDFRLISPNDVKLSPKLFS